MRKPKHDNEQLRYSSVAQQPKSSVGHTQSISLLRSSDQTVVEDATYTRHNKHKRTISIPSAEFEPVIPESKRLQVYT